MISVLPPFLCGTKKGTAFVDQWIKDGIIHLPEVEFLPSVADKKDARYSLCPRREGHKLE